MSLAVLPVEQIQMESCVSALLRSCARNCWSIGQAFQLLGRSPPKALNADHRGCILAVTGLSVHWMEGRLPEPKRIDDQAVMCWGGQVWLERHTMRGVRQQLCPQCLREGGWGRMEWDLLLYPCCHVHSLHLVDNCRHCGVSIGLLRPAPELCSCGHFYAAAKPPEQPSELLVKWCTWLSGWVALGMGQASRPPSDELLPALLRGCTPDGACRLLLAACGGPKMLAGLKGSMERPWVPSAGMARLLEAGLVTLQALSSKGSLGRGNQPPCATSIAKQVKAGLTAQDRLRALHLLNASRPWSNGRKPRLTSSQQLDLFEGGELP